MTDRFATTPFGGRSLSYAMLAAQEKTARARERMADATADHPEKWPLLRSLTEARAAFFLSDRAIAVLEALLSFHPETVLDGSAPLIVFPSNAELSMRTRGMAPATIRRHLASLVEAGLIIRRDSPNGKRYARRGDTGEIERAFGFDISPLALHHAEIEAHAADARNLARAIHRIRSEITIHLRDISKTIEAGLSEGRPGDWTQYAEELAALSGRVGRNLPLETLERRRDALTALRVRVEKSYLASLSDEEMSASDSSFERHIQNSNIEHQFEKSPEKGLKQSAAPQAETGSSGKTAALIKMRKQLNAARGNRNHPQPDGRKSMSEPGTAQVPLTAVLSACPQIGDYARAEIADWRDLVQAAGVVRSMLGVSPDAWDRAKSTMGEVNAAITVAAILERVGDIRSPGGYLRALTDRAEDGLYSVVPIIKALRGSAPARLE
ncbi:plasmid replication protein RepC [Phyllobacterium pellucidum]|uniref:plasmid replication protein RepC n=1 Tax=Phyllobacterium pellucidum TaxID=2740464 RepID=UPI001D15BCAC|nr:plasmid replication protein RepC [Phyllobacterium sp. T1018]UGY11386.1 replication initiation protein RepC [Phyllobacterium sp. T1018]